MSDCPWVTPELVQFLDSAFPDRCPDPSWGERQVWMAAGAASVVATLKVALDNQKAAATSPVKDNPSHVLLQPGDEDPGGAPSAPGGRPAGPGNRC